MLEEKDLQKLLRLKRYEQPPQGYFEDFLKEFHRRQREEMLRRPAWRIALDRAAAYIGEITMPRIAYAAASAAVLAVAGIASWNIVSFESSTPSASVVAAAFAEAPRPAVALAFGEDLFRNAALGDSPATASSARPHYVMDARPVSYEPPFSF